MDAGFGGWSTLLSWFWVSGGVISQGNWLVFVVAGCPEC